MADERIATIVKEIKYWKEHKLLPEVQCDFLLALYTQGENEEEVPIKKKSSTKFIFYFQLILLVLMVPFSFLVIYFTQFNSILQLSILFLFIGYALWVFIYFKRGNSRYVHIPIIVFLVLLLMVTDFVIGLLQLNQEFTILALILNFLGWYVISRKFNYKYLLVSSVLALITLLFLNFSHLFSFN